MIDINSSDGLAYKCSYILKTVVVLLLFPFCLVFVTFGSENDFDITIGLELKGIVKSISMPNKLNQLAQIKQILGRLTPSKKNIQALQQFITEIEVIPEIKTTLNETDNIINQVFKPALHELQENLQRAKHLKTLQLQAISSENDPTEHLGATGGLCSAQAPVGHKTITLENQIERQIAHIQDLVPRLNFWGGIDADPSYQEAKRAKRFFIKHIDNINIDFRKQELQVSQNKLLSLLFEFEEGLYYINGVPNPKTGNYFPTFSGYCGLKRPAHISSMANALLQAMVHSGFFMTYVALFEILGAKALAPMYCNGKDTITEMESWVALIRHLTSPNPNRINSVIPLPMLLLKHPEKLKSFSNPQGKAYDLYFPLHLFDGIDNEPYATALKTMNFNCNSLHKTYEYLKNQNWRTIVIIEEDTEQTNNEYTLLKQPNGTIVLLDNSNVTYTVILEELFRTFKKDNYFFWAIMPGPILNNRLNKETKSL